MPYRLKPGKLTPKRVRKIASEQTARALTALAKDDVTPLDVHEGRKVVKRLRSLLKLIEPALEANVFTQRYRALGRAGDALAGARDRHVMDRTVELIEQRFGAEGVAAVAFVRKGLSALPSSGSAGLDEKALARARAAFAKEARKLETLKIKGEGLALFSRGLEDTYAAARRNFARAYDKPDDERFHEFRKAVQWHWRHMALLSRAWPEYYGVRITACQQLADALGDDHDLFVLLSAARRMEHSAAAFTAFERLVRLRQGELRQLAYALGERLFAERPAAFRARMETYWSAKMPLASARQEAEDADADA